MSQLVRTMEIHALNTIPVHLSLYSNDSHSHRRQSDIWHNVLGNFVKLGTSIYVIKSEVDTDSSSFSKSFYRFWSPIYKLI